MAKENNISILISAVDEASKVFRGIGGTITNFGKRNEKTFRAMRDYGTVAFGAIAASAMTSINAFKESEAQMARVDQILKNIDYKGLSVDIDTAGESARDFGTKLQGLSGIGDEMASESFAKLFQITKDVTQAQELAMLSADLSIAKNIDMDSSTKLVAMALAGNTRALKEYGIELDENATPLQALEELQKRVGGQAEAYGKTLEGQSKIMSQSFGDMQESIGQALAPALSSLLASITPIIQSFAKWASENPETLKTIIMVAGGITALIAVVGVLGLAIPAIITGITALGTAFTFLTLNPIGLTIVALTALVTAGWYLYENWDQIKINIVLLWDQLSRDFSMIIDLISLKFSKWTESLKILLGKLWESFKTIIDGAKVSIVNATSGLFNSMYETVQSIFNSITEFVSSKVDWIVRQLQKAKDALYEIATLGNADTATFNGPKLATGGYFSGNGPIMVGENGPEILVPTGSGHVIPNSKIGGGQSINISFGNVTVSNGMELNDLTDKIKSVIYNEHKYARLGY